MSGRFTDKVALVTGGASGIGLESTRRFVAEGAQVAVVDLDEAKLAAVAEELGDAVLTHRADVSSEDDVAAAVDATIERFGRLDVVYANAGIGGGGRITDMSLADWQRVLDINLTGPMLLIKHAAPKMNDGGSILVTASLNAVQAGHGMGAYCASKAGVAMLVRVAAMELGPRGIRVNAIAPGFVMTPLTEGVQLVPQILDEYVDNTVLGRYAAPAEIAALAAFLASDDAGFITGTLQLIDGGAANNRYPDIPGILEAAVADG